MPSGAGLTRVFLHAFTDGRDTPPNSGLGYIRQIEAKMKEIGVGQIATVSGRYCAMDRDNRWPRVREGVPRDRVRRRPEVPHRAEAAISYYYDHPTEPNMSGDEFVTPSVITRRRRHAARDRPRRRLGHLLQLSRRPPARDDQGVRPRRFHRLRSRHASSNLYLRDDDRVRAGPAGARRVSQAAEDDEHPRRVHLEQGAEAVPLRRDREVSRTSRSSSTTTATRPSPARTARSSPRPSCPTVAADTYDQMPEMSAYGVCDEVVKRIDIGPVRPDRRELRQRRHGRPHRRARGRGQGGRSRRRLRRPDPRRRRSARAASRSSPPTTATANR